MGDWADEKARESEWPCIHQEGWSKGECQTCLAALLREVAADAVKTPYSQRADLLAEVRRVVEEQRETVRGTYWVSKSGTHLGDASVVCDEILSRMGKL